MRRELEVFIIGGGTAGSEAAFRLADAGADRIGIAERDRFGGECTFDGCVPTKALIRAAGIAAEARVAGRFGVDVPSVDVDLRAVRLRVSEVVRSRARGPAPFERAGIDVFPRPARVIGPNEIELDDATVLRADRIVLATGTRPVIPPVPGLQDGPVWTSTEAIWAPSEVPGRLAILGGGAIGVEFAQIYARFGASVTLLEENATILSNEDPDAAACLAAALEEDGIEIRTGTALERAAYEHGVWSLTDARGGSVKADAVLVATGREPVLREHDLDAAGVELDDHDRPVLDERLRTTSPSIYAAGDATGELLFTHVANYEAQLVADVIAGGQQHRDYRVVPRVTFTSPEVASVGLTEPGAREAHRDIRVGRSDLADNERSQIDGRTRGMVKVVTDPDGAILGGHVVAHEAGAMIHELVALMAVDVPSSTGAAAIHAYPTLSESIGEALRKAG